LPNDGREVLAITSVRTFRQAEHERTHIGELQKQVRSTTLRFLQAALDMGIFGGRSKKRPAG
jgi:hypothetical protein